MAVDQENAEYIHLMPNELPVTAPIRLDKPFRNNLYDVVQQLPSRQIFPFYDFDSLCFLANSTFGAQTRWYQADHHPINSLTVCPIIAGLDQKGILLLCEDHTSSLVQNIGQAQAVIAAAH